MLRAVLAVEETPEDVPEEELADALSGVTVEQWILAGVVLVAAFALSRVVRRLTERQVERGDSEGSVARFVGRVVGYVVVAGGVVYALSILQVRLSPILGLLGITGLAVAFAAQTILENFFSSVLLQTRRPFRRGDQIQTLGELEGTVEDVNFRTVVLRTYAGERVLIPCSEVLNNPITNFTANGLRRTTLPVGVAYGTDLPTARDVLLRAARQVEGVRVAPPVEAWVEQFGESSIDFALRFWHAPDIATMWRVRSGVAMTVKAAFDDTGIEIPFPQRTVGFLPGADRMEVRTRALGSQDGIGGDG